MLFVQEGGKPETKQLISARDIEWRFVLSQHHLTLRIQLPYIGNKDLPLGVLKIELHIGSTHRILKQISEGDIKDLYTKKKEKQLKKFQVFFEKSKIFWSNFIKINPRFKLRAIKIFVEDVHRKLKPVTTFIKKLRCRALGSPKQAARFVSLLPLEENKHANSALLWMDYHTFLSVKKGSAFDHSILLCCLLLGHKLDAFMCLGASSDGVHAWVMTRVQIPEEELEIELDRVVKKGSRAYELRKNGKKGIYEAIKLANIPRFKYQFWESLTGKIFEQSDPRINFYYRKLGCMFNNEVVYANCQPRDVVSDLDLNLEDPSCWKALDVPNFETDFEEEGAGGGLAALIGKSKDSEEVHIPRELQLSYSKSREETLELENSLEFKLLGAIRFHRNLLKRACKIDEDLCFLMSQALIYFEQNASLGFEDKSRGSNSEFKQAVRNHVPDYYRFKALPLQFTHTDPGLIMKRIKANKVGRDILDVLSDDVNYGLRCKVVSYPEGVMAVWVMISCYFFE